MSHLGITTQRFLHVVCILFLLLLVLLSSTTCQLSLDAITSNQPIRDGDFLVSSKKIFTLGFFTPGSSRHRYVGVWYTIDPNQIVVWVANRDNPINDSSGVLSITNDRGLVIHANSSSIDLWSSNVTLSSPNTCVAKLLDSGNLVLLESEKSGKLVWQGFDHPTDTLLPSMKIGLNRTAGWTRFLTSWKSRDDPGTGNCTHVLAPNGVPRFVLYRGGELKWRGSPWINDKWNDLPATNPGEFSVTIVNNDDETSYVLLAPKDSSILVRGMADEAGVFRRFMWNDQEKNWTNLVNYPSQLCDSYGQCGPNSHCDANKNYAVACTCLPGYEPKSPSDWNLTLWAGGCVRKSGVSVCQKGDGFVKVERMEVPDTPMARVNTSVSLKDCKAECLMNCSCMSYASADEEGDGYGCVTWYGDLMDTKTYSYTGQSNLYVRVDATTLAQYAKSKDPLIKKEMALVSSASVAVFLLLLLALCLLVRRNIEGERRRKRYAFILAPGSTYFEDSKGGTAFDDSRMNSELTFFHLKTIATATNNFSIENKLGEGGFGSVYKGILRDGNELAIKRLSKYSGQGVEEFKNEVLLIAKLQHRNLVRILGCCVEDEEKLLIYEYLPNKSLDGFIFGDETKRASLDWTRRFEIILGIARGVLYLHEDSRLRIIHRDLKTSNILLDNAFNPKIADFGMARIFRAEQNEANTNRVVGTYGYMSPEYAMRGLFSIKSDVYSFGIILLEIITGKKNAGYHHEGYPDSSMVWELWKQGRSEDSIDSCIGEAYLVNEVERCIQIALLCVQEFPNDRPTMSAVVSMFGNDAALASPSQPAFTLKRLSNGELSGSEGGCFSVNELTCTIVQVR